MLETPEKLPHDIVESVADICNRNLDVLLYKCTYLLLQKMLRGHKISAIKGNSEFIVGIFGYI